MLKTKTKIENGMKENGLPILTNMFWDILCGGHSFRHGDVDINRETTTSRCFICMENTC